jgi:hypothetical protein
MSQTTYENPYPWKIHRDGRGRMRWWQRWYEAWLVLTGSYTFWHAWDHGKSRGAMQEYDRVVNNGGDLVPLIEAAIDELCGDLSGSERRLKSRDVWARYKARRSHLRFSGTPTVSSQQGNCK